MWQYNNTNELVHYGVIGMKWGQRRARSYQKKITSTRAIGKKDADSFNPYLKTGIKTKKGKIIMTAKDVSDSKKAIEQTTKKKVDKYQEKITKIKNKEKNFGGAAKRVEKMSALDTVLKASLLGTYGTVKYEQSRAEGKARVDSVMNSIRYSTVDGLTSGIYSFAEARRNRMSLRRDPLTPLSY